MKGGRASARATARAGEGASAARGAPAALRTPPARPPADVSRAARRPRGPGGAGAGGGARPARVNRRGRARGASFPPTPPRAPGRTPGAPVASPGVRGSPGGRGRAPAGAGPGLGARRVPSAPRPALGWRRPRCPGERRAGPPPRPSGGPPGSLPAPGAASLPSRPPLHLGSSGSPSRLLPCSRGRDLRDREEPVGPRKPACRYLALEARGQVRSARCRRPATIAGARSVAARREAHSRRRQSQGLASGLGLPGPRGARAGGRQPWGAQGGERQGGQRGSVQQALPPERRGDALLLVPVALVWLRSLPDFTCPTPFQNTNS